MVTTVNLDFDGDDDDGTGALTMMVGQLCNGYTASTVMCAMMYIMADCAVQSHVPKAEFLARVYEDLGNYYDDMGGNDGRSTHN